jgi:shikimate kinase/3-dehydroquinate synthase
MTRNIAMKTPRPPVIRDDTVVMPPHLQGRSIVLVGLMGAGKTSIGRRLAARFGLPFYDADAEIELAAGCSIAELFARFGEAEFRQGERRVIRRLLAGEPMVLATGGGAFMDPDTRASVRRDAVSLWLRASLPTLVRRVAQRSHRPLLAGGDPASILKGLIEKRHPFYAEADVVLDVSDESPEITTARAAEALLDWQAPRRLSLALSSGSYDVVVGAGLLERAGALLAPVLPQKRCVIITDSIVEKLHLSALQRGLDATGFAHATLVVPPGERAKSVAQYTDLVERLLDLRVERRTAILALGGGVVGDLAGFAAATVLRGLPFVQIPTTLLAQVDSSVGGKTGINTAHGKNLLGAFHQPRMVLADADTLATLPERELRAGYAEIAKAGLIGDAAFFAWCEAHGSAILAGDREAQAEAVLRACAFKAQVVGDDEREEKPSGGRALLNLGHTFGHAIEAESGYGQVLHGEAVAAGIGLAFQLATRLGQVSPEDTARVIQHLEAMGLPGELSRLNRRFKAQHLMDHMARDKKMRDGALHLILPLAIGQCVTTSDTPRELVLETLLAAGCEA